VSRESYKNQLKFCQQFIDITKSGTLVLGVFWPGEDITQK